MKSRHRGARSLASLIVAAGLLALAGSLGSARAATSERDAAELGKASYIYIATVRKDGNQSTAVPVWFTTTADNRILIDTGPQSWKAKRIRRGSPALVWIGTRTGAAFIGTAEITTDKALQDKIIGGYPEKYLLARIGFARPTREKFDAGKIVAIRIIPVRDLAPSFTSEPGTPAPALDATAQHPKAQ